MFIRKKGKYLQICEFVDGKQKVLVHAGTIEKLKEIVENYKILQNFLGTERLKEIIDTTKNRPSA